MKRNHAVAGWIFGVLCFVLAGGPARALPVDVTYNVVSGGAGADSVGVFLSGGNFTVRFAAGALSPGGALTGPAALRTINVSFTSPLLLPNWWPLHPSPVSTARSRAERSL